MKTRVEKGAQILPFPYGSGANGKSVLQLEEQADQFKEAVTSHAVVAQAMTMPAWATSGPAEEARHIGRESRRTGPEGQSALSRRGVTMVRSGMVTKRDPGCSTSTS